MELCVASATSKTVSLPKSKTAMKKIKKEILHGWIGRDIDGVLYFGEQKPVNNSGIFTYYGNHAMRLYKYQFPEIKHKKSPVQATLTIEIEIEQ